ncbi:hypothetical protein E2C01_014976 [Portunus trituberculatus]|uniref:Uncharacterized protein n=1 Tax=Portunus trituberculatus TaxID=210409 RepID=A0A5B7DK47_PORTR|nr:hypothetical protein [Portunus trituberculatus]
MLALIYHTDLKIPRSTQTQTQTHVSLRICERGLHGARQCIIEQLCPSAEPHTSKKVKSRTKMHPGQVVQDICISKDNKAKAAFSRTPEVPSLELCARKV